jgi:hypothetical protein
MSIKFRALAGAIALAIGSTAMANTTLDASGSGDLFINVVDTSNNTSFLFDTGVSQASFNGAGSLSYNFNTLGAGGTPDANYASFVAGEGANDTVEYSVLSATRTSATPNVGTILFTSNAGPAAQNGFSISQTQVAIGGFFNNANNVTSSTSNSALLNSSTTWGQNAYEQTVSSELGIPWTQAGTGDAALAGNPLDFFSESSSKLASQLIPATLTTFAGTWDFANGVATYSAVPLPTPVLLLLSGLGLMGAVSRRGKGKVVAA